MRAPLRTLSVVAAGLALVGCIDDLPMVQVIEDSRILGARMSVDGDEQRAWPMRDESGTVTFFVVDPLEEIPVGWGFLVCPAEVTPTGLRFCAGDPLDLVFQMEPSLDPPAFPVSFPSDRLTGVSEVLVQGVICPNSSPTIDMANMDIGCSDDARRQLVTYSIRLATDDSSNRNPTVPADAFTFEGAAWPESATVPPETGCAAMAGTPELPLAARGTAESAPELVLGITADPADREEYPSGEQTSREDLVYAGYTNIGQTARQFTVIDDANPSAELKWTPPDDRNTIAEDGSLVRFWFTLTDQRGGATWTRRYACVTR